MTTKVVAFTDVKEASTTQRKNLSPILDFHLHESEIGLGPANPSSPLRLTPDPAEAEYFILPKHWTCYLWNGRAELPSAQKFAELADRYGKPLLIWFKGDLVPRIPFDNYRLFLPGIVKTTQKSNHIACPALVEDPEHKFGATRLRTKNDIPTVGFCGYAAAGSLKITWSILNGLRHKVAEELGFGDFEETPVLPSTFLRSRVLSNLSKSDLVRTNFLIRRKYTPPTSNGDAATYDKTVAEFHSNIFETDYTVCMRGYGNWSYRFYQTLACGRIPLFVDTDCVLPLDNIIDWKNHAVWIDRSELPYLAEKIVESYSGLSGSDFADRQVACRRLWESRLTLKGFMNDLRLYLS